MGPALTNKNDSDTAAGAEPEAGAAEARVKAAKSEVEAAEAEVKAAKSEVEAAEARVKAAKSEVEAAEAEVKSEVAAAEAEEKAAAEKALKEKAATIKKRVRAVKEKVVIALKLKNAKCRAARAGKAEVIALRVEADKKLKAEEAAKKTEEKAKKAKEAAKKAEEAAKKAAEAEEKAEEKAKKAEEAAEKADKAAKDAEENAAAEAEAASLKRWAGGNEQYCEARKWWLKKTDCSDRELQQYLIERFPFISDSVNEKERAHKIAVCLCQSEPHQSASVDAISLVVSLFALVISIWAGQFKNYPQMAGWILLSVIISIAFYMVTWVVLKTVIDRRLNRDTEFRGRLSAL